MQTLSCEMDSSTFRGLLCPSQPNEKFNAAFKSVDQQLSLV